MAIAHWAVEHGHTDGERYDTNVYKQILTMIERQERRSDGPGEEIGGKRLHMYVCMYVCMYIYIHPGMHACTHIRKQFLCLIRIRER